MLGGDNGGFEPVGLKAGADGLSLGVGENSGVRGLKERSLSATPAASVP